MRAAVLFTVALVACPLAAAAFDPDTSLSTASASFIGEDSFDCAGWSIASGGDVNSDGFDDILIGADNDEKGGSGAGQTYLILGKASGWEMDSSVEEAATASFLGEDIGDGAGRSVAFAGDVNDDGFDDILIGADENDDGGDRAGQAYLVLGKASDWSLDTPLSGADASFIAEEAGDHAGGAVASAGDVDGDGLDEILIGATWRNQYQGETYLIRGRETGWGLDTDLATADASFVGEDAYDYAGFILGSGDVNGDGNSDLLISAAYDGDGGSYAGQTYLIIAPAACGDGLDNDGDGFTDFAGGDPGCADAADLSERSPLLACDDGADNDGDGATDYPADIGCKNPTWPSESPECSDGIDNDDNDEPPLADWDGAGLGDPDPQCLAPWDKSEAPSSRPCGLGAELALLLPPLMRLSRRRFLR